MQAGAKIYSLLADLVLLVHFAFVAFVALGFLAIWVGYFCRWPFVRDLRFRVAHLLAMGVVLAESSCEGMGAEQRAIPAHSSNTGSGGFCFTIGANKPLRSFTPASSYWWGLPFGR